MSKPKHDWEATATNLAALARRSIGCNCLMLLTGLCPDCLETRYAANKVLSRAIVRSSR